MPVDGKAQDYLLEECLKILQSQTVIPSFRYCVVRIFHFPATSECRDKLREENILFFCVYWTATEFD